MKIAILMHGLAGKTDKYGTGKNIDVNLSYEHMKKHILDVNPNDQIDFFMHSWSIEQENNLKELYHPKSSMFEKQIIFDFSYVVGNPDGPGGESNRWVDGKFKGVENLRFHSLFSRWYSAKTVNELRRQHQEKTNTQYDFVMLTRYDLAYLVDFNFSKFDKEKFYIIPPVDIGHGIQDLWFISNPNNIDTLCGMFDWIKTIKHFPHKFTHSHWLSMHYLNATGVMKNFAFIGPERPWGQGKIGAKMGPSPLVRDHYEIAESTPDEDMGRVRNEIVKGVEKIVK